MTYLPGNWTLQGCPIHGLIVGERCGVCGQFRQPIAVVPEAALSASGDWQPGPHPGPTEKGRAEPPQAKPRSTPPLDEWLKGDEAVEALVASEAAYMLIQDEQGPFPGTAAYKREIRQNAREILDALLQALAEHRKESGGRE